MDLVGKHVLFLGSSVTYGSASGGVSFVEYLAESMGLFACKEAVSGTVMPALRPNSYVERLRALDPSQAFDLLVCQLSTNDATKGIPQEATLDAVAEIVALARSRYGCSVVFYTSPKFPNTRYGELVDALHSLQPTMGFAVLDLWNDAEQDRLTEEERRRWMKDPIHPTAEGYKQLWAPRFENFLKNLNLED